VGSKGLEPLTPSV